MSLQVKTTNFIGKELHYFDEIDSTNKFAKHLIANSKPSHGSVILAEFQKAGRGQDSNTWHSAPGKNLLFTIIFQPEKLTVKQQFICNKFISVALAETLQGYVRGKVEIKWPNDLLINGRKIAGILIETFLKGNNIGCLIVGVGCNVNQIHFPSNLLNATSLQLEEGIEVDRNQLLEKLFVNFEKWISRFNQDRFGDIKRAYYSRLFQYQEQHTYSAKAEVFRGEIIGVNTVGALVMNVNGSLRTFANKEIKFL